MSTAFECFSRLDRVLEYVVDLPVGQRLEVMKRRLASSPSLHAVADRLLDQATSSQLDFDCRQPQHELIGKLLREEDLVGQTVGKYEVNAVLGYGGMGKVLLATDPRLGRQVALKTLPPAKRACQDLRRRLLREARVLSNLDHPGIVTLFDVVRHQSASYLVMEYVAGRDLSALIGSGGVERSELVDLALQICDGVAAVHQAGFIHRDLKPTNIRVRNDGCVKILDFGLARPLARDFQTSMASLTVPGRVMGSPLYLSPEQSRGETMDERSDVFALGVLLFELATGVRPFSGESIDDYRSSLACEPPPSVLDHRQDLPQDFDRVIRRCLRKRRAQRFSSGTEVRDALRHCFKKRNPAFGPATGILAAGAGLAIAGLLLERRRHRRR